MKRTTAAVTAALMSAMFVGMLAVPAHAGPIVANFNGEFTTTCDLSYTPDGTARSGPYTCNHTAASIACAGVSSTAAPTPLCSAKLVSGYTAGFATGNEPVNMFQLWGCWDGSGWGTFRYQPSPAEPTFEFDVSLVMDYITRQVLITGSRYDSERGGFVTVRASIPAHCTPYVTATEGFQGSITPN